MMSYFLFFIATVLAGTINALAGGGGLIVIAVGFAASAFYLWKFYGPAVMRTVAG